MTITRDAMRAVHLGERMDEGVRWSGDTQDRQLALVTAKARDAVTAFLDPGYVERAVRDLESTPGARSPTRPGPSRWSAAGCATAKRSRRRSSTTSSRAVDLTAGGVMHAVTSAAQVQQDGDAAWELENSALDALSLAAAL